MVKKKIYLFRHGLTTFNRDRKFTGFTDAKLTKAGRDDAGIVASRLKVKKIDVSFHTSLSRSKDTLNIVIKDHPECTLFIEDDRMIERNYGKLNTHSHFEIVKKYGFKKYDEWHRGYKTPPPGGESFYDVEVRVRSFIKDLKKFIKKHKVNVAISAHGNSIRLFRKVWEGASVEEMTHWSIPYDNYYEYSLEV